MRPREVALRAAGRLEQEIRAYPRVYSAFYTALTRNRMVREMVGRAKDGVRGGGFAATDALVAEPPLLRQRREAAVAARLGLRA